jgi:hypothetical protein
MINNDCIIEVELELKFMNWISKLNLLVKKKEKWKKCKKILLKWKNKNDNDFIRFK